jgi:hypothetical protein
VCDVHCTSSKIHTRTPAQIHALTET